MLFAAEIGGDFAPAVGFPFEDGVLEGVGLEPAVGAGEEARQGAFGGEFHGGAVGAAAHPREGCDGVGVDWCGCVAFLCEQGEGMDYAEVFAYVV